MNLLKKGWNTMIRNKIAYGAITLKSPASWKYMKKGELLFHSPREALLQYQDRQYQKLLLYAYEHTKYYRRVFDDIALIREGIIDKKRYRDIPILTKDIIRKEGSTLISDEAGKRGFYTNTSGGSTGEPVCFVQDKEYFACNFGDKILFGVLNGKLPGDKEIKLWGSERDILEGSIGIKEKCINWCFNRKFLNSFVLTPKQMEEYARLINKEKPVQIWAYADSVYQLARFASQNNIPLFSPRNIVTTAGVLYDEMREEIKNAFPYARVLNQYGSREAGVIGCESEPNHGIRIFEHSVKAEILDHSTGHVSGHGEGELLITNLTNYSMPLIRYRIGDTGEISDGSEGLEGSFAVLKRLTGRTNAHLKKEDGSLVHGEYVTHLFYHKEWIENFKVIQHAYKEIEFQIVRKKETNVNNAELEQMKSDLIKVIDGCRIQVSFVEEIPKLKSGKYQYVISEV